jgi:hypothetical protein
LATNGSTHLLPLSFRWAQRSCNQNTNTCCIRNTLDSRRSCSNCSLRLNSMSGFWVFPSRHANRAPVARAKSNVHAERLTQAVANETKTRKPFVAAGSYERIRKYAGSIPPRSLAPNRRISKRIATLDSSRFDASPTILEVIRRECDRAVHFPTTRLQSH